MTWDGTKQTIYNEQKNLIRSLSLAICLFILLWFAEEEWEQLRPNTIWVEGRETRKDEQYVVCFLFLNKLCCSSKLVLAKYVNEMTCRNVPQTSKKLSAEKENAEEDYRRSDGKTTTRQVEMYSTANVSKSWLAAAIYFPLFKPVRFNWSFLLHPLSPPSNEYRIDFPWDFIQLNPEPESL